MNKNNEKGAPSPDCTKSRNGAALIIYFLRGSKRYFIISILASLVVNFFEMINPQIISFTVDSVLGNEKSDLPDLIENFIDRIGGVEYLKDHLYLIAFLILICAAFSVVCRYIQNVYNSKGAQSLVESMRNKLFAHIEKLPFSWHMKNHTGDIIQRCTSDVDMINNFISSQLTSIVELVLFIAVAMFFMFRMNVKLAAIAALTLPVILAYSIFFRRGISECYLEFDEAEGKLSAIAQENLTGVRVVRAFGRESYEKDRFEKQSEKYCTIWNRLSVLQTAFWCMGDLISGLQVMIIIIVGTVFAVRGEMTTGDFIAFVSYNSMLTWPVRSLGRMVSEMSKAGVSIGRIAYIMNSEPERDSENALTPTISGDIVFDSVNFAYEDCPEILHDISFTVKAGTTLGIIGGTGSGKSTLMYLLTRLYELPPENGKISIGGVDISKINARHLRRNIGIVLQEPYLFSRTLGENISISRSCADINEIRSAAKIASLDSTVESFTHGYNTYVGERGVTLSGGQKQRTAIARMLMQKAPIMIFDDSLSAVDAETDAKIRSALSGAMGDATVIIISHRTSTLSSADKILVMDKGRIRESGTHEELFAQNGLYRRICDIQSANADENETAEKEVTA